MGNKLYDSIRGIAEFLYPFYTIPQDTNNFRKYILSWGILIEEIGMKEAINEVDDIPPGFKE